MYSHISEEQTESEPEPKGDLGRSNEKVQKGFLSSASLPEAQYPLGPDRE